MRELRNLGHYCKVLTQIVHWYQNKIIKQRFYEIKSLASTGIRTTTFSGSAFLTSINRFDPAVVTCNSSFMSKREGVRRLNLQPWATRTTSPNSNSSLQKKQFALFVQTSLIDHARNQCQNQEPLYGQMASDIRGICNWFPPSVFCLISTSAQCALNGQQLIIESRIDFLTFRNYAFLLGQIKDKYVIEVGPGPGGITKTLLEGSPKQVLVIEKDPRFIPSLQLLQEAAGGPSKLKISIGDCLHYNVESKNLAATFFTIRDSLSYIDMILTFISLRQ